MNALKIIPYLQVDGVWTFRDSQIKNFYVRMNEESPHVFKDGSIATPEAFLHELKHNPDNQLYVSVLDGEPIALGWFNQFQYKHCQGHFCSFKEYRGNKILVEAARKTLKIVFELNGCPVLLGLIPASNLTAILFMKKYLSGEEIGRLHNGCWDEHSKTFEDAVLIQVKREAYDEGLH
jgi:hypothetical protein